MRTCKLVLGAASVAVGLAAGATARAAIVHEFTFDDVATGTPANLAPQPPALGVEFHNAAFTPDYDVWGDAIPGTERWRIDSSAPAVIVDNPVNYNRGNAPSPLNALEALFQPVMITFDSAFDIEPAGFSMVLDLDTFGVNGLLPGNEGFAVQFLDSTGGLLAAAPLDQTTPGFSISTGGVDGVSSILLPAGAFYDNVRIAGVPEPATLVMLTIGGILVIRRLRLDS